MNTTTVSVVGTVATDPRRITSQSGVTICSFRLASGERRYDPAQQKWIDGDTNWFGVTAFRTLADHALASLQKGERVLVTGRLRIRKWDSGERSGTSAEIDAEALGHDLRWGVSRFEKRVGATGAEDASGTSSPGLSSGAADGARSESEASGTGGIESGNAAPQDAGSPGWSNPTPESEARSADGFLPAAA